MTVIVLLLVVIIMILLGILAAMKTGLNQVIRGLEALEQHRGAEP